MNQYCYLTKEELAEKRQRRNATAKLLSAFLLTVQDPEIVVHLMYETENAFRVKFERGSVFRYENIYFGDPAKTIILICYAAVDSIRNTQNTVLTKE